MKNSLPINILLLYQTLNLLVSENLVLIKLRTEVQRYTIKLLHNTLGTPCVC